MKRLIALFLALTMMALLLNSCTTSDNQTASSGNQTASSGDTNAPTKVTFGLVQDPSSLTPFGGGKDYINYIQNCCYQKLCIRDGFSSDMIPVLVKSYTQDDDKTVTLKLYDNITDSAGNPITASDIVFSFNTALETKNYNRIAPLKEVTAVHDTTVKMTFKSTIQVGDLENCLCEIYIVAQKSYEASSDKLATTSAGTGPYVVSEFKPGVKVVLTRNDKYWQSADLNSIYYAANVDTIEFDVVRDASSLAIAMQTGDIDMTTYLNVTDVTLFKQGGESADKFSVNYIPNGYLYTLEYNGDSTSPLYNANLRKAIAYAIDRNSIGKTMYGDAASPVYALSNPNFNGYDTSWESKDYYGYDVAKAKEYLKKYQDETGIDPSTLKLDFIVGTMAAFKTIGESVQSYLSAIGLDVTFTQYDAATSNTMKKDPSQWDLSVTTGLSYCYITDNWDLMFDANDYAWGGSKEFVKDDKLQQLLELCKSKEGFTNTNINTMKEYIDDNCYLLGLFNYEDAAVVPKTCTKVVSDSRGMIWPNACSYSWN